MKDIETIKIRFLKYVAPPNENLCHLWLGADKRAYGKFWDGDKYESAHRVSYRLHKGEIPAGMVVMHTCDVSNCVNPNHLVLGTQSENVIDCVVKGRADKTTKARGEFSGRAILHEENVLEILKSRETTANLARKFGVNFMTVSAVRHNKSWKHIER
jgi:hypothetical protein